MEIYKIFYQEEYEHPNDIELVSPDYIIQYVRDLLSEGRISDDSYEIFKEKHIKGIQTKEDAVELLETDGYIVILSKVIGGK